MTTLREAFALQFPGLAAWLPEGPPPTSIPDVYLEPLPFIDWKPTGYEGPGMFVVDEERFTVTADDGTEVVPMPVIGDEKQASWWRIVRAIGTVAGTLGMRI